MAREPTRVPDQRALLKEIKLQAVRAMATEQLHRTLTDKEWAKMALQPEWQLLQASPRHMEADLAMKRDTHIFKILATGPLQRANDYMAQTIENRAKASIHSRARRKVYSDSLTVPLPKMAKKIGRYTRISLTPLSSCLSP